MLPPLGRAGEPTLHTGSIDFQVGRAITVRDGMDGTLISTGGMLENCVEGADGLTAEGLQIKVHQHAYREAAGSGGGAAGAASTGVILTVEEHSEIGGLGSAVGDVLLHAGYPGIFRKVALPDRFTAVAGDYEYLPRARWFRCGRHRQCGQKSGPLIAAPARRAYSGPTAVA